MMHHSHLESLLSIVTNAWLPNVDAMTNILLYLLLLNVRACLLLAGCLLLLRLIKGSASLRHFLIAVSVAAIALLPLTSRLIPAFNVAIETPYLQEIGVETGVADSMSVMGDGGDINLFTPKLFYLGCLCIYFLGLAVILAKVLLGNLRLFLLVKLCRPVNQQNWLDNLEKHRINLGICRAVELRHSNLNVSPSTWGALRPVILLPSSALQWPDHLIQSTLLHELAHIKRYDWLVQQIVRCIYAFYWINPLCRIAVNKLFAHAETACDDLAINAGVSNLDYAESLVDVAEQVLRRRHHGCATIAMASHGKHGPLSDRVLAILNHHECRVPITKIQVLTALPVFLCVLLPLTSVRANFVEQPVEPPQAAAVEKRVYTPRNPNDHTRTIPVDILTPETAIEKNGLNEPADPVTPGRKLAELKQILEADNAEPHAVKTADNPISGFARDQNTLPKHGEPPRLTSISANDILKEHLEKTLNKIAQALVNRQSLGDTTAAPETIVSHSPVNMVIPEYPYRARTRGVEGEVTVEYSLDEHGRVVDAEIVSSPSTLFNRHVIKAIKSSTFLPRMVNGKPVPAEGLVEKYVFVLET